MGWEEKYKALLKRNQELEQRLLTFEESKSKYKTLFESSDDAILVLENSTFIDCNNALVRMFGFDDKTQVLNIHPSGISPKFQKNDKDSWKEAEKMIAMAIKKGSHHFEWTHTRANGEDFPAEVWLSRIDFDGRVLVNAILRDLTDIKAAEQIILKNLEEKEILIKEIHHRVKNNLQLIISLLNLQSEYVNNTPAERALVESKNRIASISKVHEMLYMAENLSEIQYRKYLDELLATLVDNLSGDFRNIDFHTDVKQLCFNINTAIPLGLMINEMVTNSLKYAFPDKAPGLISIALKKLQKNKFYLKYDDNGVGYDEHTNFENVETLGFQLISSLVEQLNGEIKRLTDQPGTHYEVVFEGL